MHKIQFLNNEEYGYRYDDMRFQADFKMRDFFLFYSPFEIFL